jgi:hypothetical protein
MAAILAELLRDGQESGRTTGIRFKRIEGMTAGEKKRSKDVLPVPCPIEQEARDNVLGGIPTTAIAGLFPTFTFQIETITPARFRLFNIVHGPKQRPDSKGDLGKRCGKV